MIWMLMACSEDNNSVADIDEPAREVAETNDPECNAEPLLGFAEAYWDADCGGYTAWDYGQLSDQAPPPLTCAPSRPFFAWTNSFMADLEPGHLAWDLSVAAAPEGDISPEGFIVVTLRVNDPSGLRDKLMPELNSLVTLTVGNEVHPSHSAYAQYPDEGYGYRNFDITFEIEPILIPANECQTFTFTVDDTDVNYMSGDWIDIQLRSALLWTTPDTEVAGFITLVEQSPFNDTGTRYIVP